MNLIVSSVTIVIAYFSTPQPIFQFGRTSGSFVLSLLTVIVGVKLINYALIMADRFAIVRRLGVWIVAVWKERRPSFGIIAKPSTAIEASNA
jgi:hypothetical protein